jgi:hypothetical protein
MIRTGVTLNVTCRSAFVALPSGLNVTFPIPNVTLNSGLGLSRFAEFVPDRDSTVSTLGARLTTEGMRCTVRCIRYVFHLQ